MSCRPHGRKPTLALWMLVGLADLVILAAATGVLAMVSIVALMAVFAGGVVAARTLTRRADTPEPAARRRA